jgi:VanZ family protein
MIKLPPQQLRRASELAIVLVVALILVTSLSPGGSFAADPIPQSTLEGSAIDINVLRAIGHATLYALLGLAAAARFAVSTFARRSPYRALAMLIMAIWLLAGGSEAMQMNVPGRAPELSDWLFDMGGAIFGLAAAGPAIRWMTRT